MDGGRLRAASVVFTSPARRRDAVVRLGDQLQRRPAALRARRRHEHGRAGGEPHDPEPGREAAALARCDTLRAGRSPSPGHPHQDRLLRLETRAADDQGRVLDEAEGRPRGGACHGRGGQGGDRRECEQAADAVDAHDVPPFYGAGGCGHCAGGSFRAARRPSAPTATIERIAHGSTDTCAKRTVKPPAAPARISLLFLLCASTTRTLTAWRGAKPVARSVSGVASTRWSAGRGAVAATPAAARASAATVVVSRASERTTRRVCHRS